MLNKLELPVPPKIDKCTSAKEMIAVRSSHDDVINSILFQELNDNRIKNRLQDELINKNSHFRITVSSFLKITVSILTIGISILMLLIALKIIKV